MVIGNDITPGMYAVENLLHLEQLETLNNLYQNIDRQANRLFAIHADRLHCRRGCSDCCVDDLTVFEVETDNIRQHHTELLETAPAHPEGACRIYANRPYVCRTQGLPLRWMDELPDGSPVEMRDICPLNDEWPPVEMLPSEACWRIGPAEETLARLQAQADGEEMRRTPLRSLFGSG